LLIPLVRDLEANWIWRILFWLNDDQWSRIEPYLPTDLRGKERVDDRRVISGILHVLKSGCRNGSDLAVRYGRVGARSLPTTPVSHFALARVKGLERN
jgi:Putative transposase of IS4/5 family (DUF4096)